MIKKKYWNELWFNNLEQVFSISEEQEVLFTLQYHNLKIGILFFANEFWHFYYSDEFKEQNVILSLANFPQKEKEYTSKELWPFFASRIPGNVQLEETDKHENNLICLLSKYGKNQYQIHLN